MQHKVLDFLYLTGFDYKTLNPFGMKLLHHGYVIFLTISKWIILLSCVPNLGA